MLGGYCLPCDSSKCATCELDRENCILPCDVGCKKCDPDMKCKLCATGYTLKEGICESNYIKEIYCIYYYFNF